jgi:hypothetical protein
MMRMPSLIGGVTGIAAGLAGEHRADQASFPSMQESRQDRQASFLCSHHWRESIN